MKRSKDRRTETEGLCLDPDQIPVYFRHIAESFRFVVIRVSETPVRVSPLKGTPVLSFLRRGYDRKSLIALGFLMVLYVAIGVVWNDLLRQNLPVVNGFLIAIWITMNALLCWDVRPSQDVTLAIVALAGGWLFESWGTHTQLWWYFTGEKPPLWILPAWPVAALATARIAYALEAALAQRQMNFVIPYCLLMAAFAGSMIRFLWPSVETTSSQVAIVWIAGVIATGRAPRRDVWLFLAGSALGIFLEYWGTSRNCWTYYTREIPPPVTVAAHGFAQIVYARVLSGLEWGLRRLGFTWPTRAGEFQTRSSGDGIA